MNLAFPMGSVVGIVASTFQINKVDRGFLSGKIFENTETTHKADVSVLRVCLLIVHNYISIDLWDGHHLKHRWLM